MLQTHYTILEVDKNATSKEIEWAYQWMVRKWHPDLNSSDPAARERFQKTQAAFDVLHNSDSRRQYDLSFLQPLGTTEVFEQSGVAKPGEPIMASADENDLDRIRFRGREPGTALQIYRHRSRWGSITDWLTSSDFVLPLLLLAVFIGIQFAGMVLEFFQRMR